MLWPEAHALGPATRLARVGCRMQHTTAQRASPGSGRVRAGKLDEAEAAARALLARYPDVHDGWDRLGMVYEVRGDNAQAVDCYRRVVAFLDENPDYSEPAFKDSFVERIAKLVPPVAT